MANVEALNAGDITKIGIIVIVALVIVGLLLSIVITAIIGRVILLVVVVALSAFVWQQRTHIKDEINTRACNLNATFFGIHLDPPDNVARICHRTTQS